VTTPKKQSTNNGSQTPADESSQDAPDIFQLPPLPSGSKGQRTRQSLVKAARRVFEQQGFIDTRLIDITSEAKCSAGTLYTYFDSKEQIFAAMLQEAQEEMLHPGLPHVPDKHDSVAIIEASTRAYLEAYRRNADLMALMEQVAQIMPAFRRLRLQRSQKFIQRNARSIMDLQKRGLADNRIDPYLASLSLSSMVSRLAYSYFVDNQKFTPPRQVSLGDLVDTITRLWVNALCIQSDDKTATEQHRAE
jgi:AcrR family transcriptional regulator